MFFEEVCCFFLLIAAGFQLAALAFFPFYFLLNRCYMQKSVVTLIFISLIFVMLGVSQKILLLGTKIPVFGEFVNYYILDFYGRNVDASYGFSVGMIVNLFLFLFLYFGMRSVYNDISNHLKIFVNLLLYSFILSCFFNAYAVFVERLVSVTNMTLLFILPYVLHKIFIGKVNKTIAFACIVVYAMLMFTKTLYTPVPLGGKYEYQFIPYQYSFVI
ncbi:EpsG family protein [Bacteroides thetaiotaomicron]|nr:EpsG family protein [Bacteroides thetaiotaomicron]UVV84624.1 EpsG family protein [Bacteroides thetaiotaomicron]